MSYRSSRKRRRRFAVDSVRPLSFRSVRVLSSATPQLLSKTWEANHQDPFTQKAKQGERRKSRIQSYGFRFKLLEFRVQERG